MGSGAEADLRNGPAGPSADGVFCGLGAWFSGNCPGRHKALVMRHFFLPYDHKEDSPTQLEKTLNEVTAPSPVWFRHLIRTISPALYPLPPSRYG